jgi:hypothetical protein
MKYTIEGFNQVELVKMGLNSNDAIILRWFVDFYATSKMAIVKNETGQEFKWVKYQAVIDDLPILGITNKQVIARHFDKMVAAGIIEKYIHKQMGVFSCFRITEKFRVLIEKLKGVDSKVETPIDSKVETKDHSIKENHSIKQGKKFIPPTKEEADAYCKEQGLNVDTFKFIKYYAAADWKIKGGTKMKNWKQALARWHTPTPEQERQLGKRQADIDVDAKYSKESKYT